MFGYKFGDLATVSVPLAATPYDILCGSGARHAIANVCTALRPARIIIVTDATVADLHLAALEAALPATQSHAVIALPPGEHTKSLAAADQLYADFARHELDRAGLVVAFGGGVVGDLAGFAAATWHRGVRWLQVPTTLEAAIDASVGGKTAVNIPAGKNLVGAFHQPSGVIIDTDFLATLPQREYAAGLAESVKHGVTRDAAFFAWHEANADAIRGRQPAMLGELIARNCAIKAAVVAADERELGLRAVLNYGHTVGHAFEALLGYELRHGECVALGMQVENRLAQQRGLLTSANADAITRLLEALELPTRLPRPLPAGEVLACCRRDKKNRSGSIAFSLPAGLGAHAFRSDFSDDEIAGALAAVEPGPRHPR